MKELVSLKAQRETAKLELEKLTATGKDAKRLRENAIKELEKVMKGNQSKLNALKAEMQKRRNRRDSIVAELKVITEDLVSLNEQVASFETSTGKLQKEILSLQKKVCLWKEIT